MQLHHLLLGVMHFLAQLHHLLLRMLPGFDHGWVDVVAVLVVDGLFLLLGELG